MTINLTVPAVNNSAELKPRICVIGVGGAGGNAVNNMIQMGLEGVDFVVANSDAQALSYSTAERRIQMGVEVTQGLGAGSNPAIGQAAAEESLDEIIAHLRDSNMVFVTAGLGGGTGTGAAPVIARAAREYGILTVGVVTKPFQFEGANRMRIAEAGLEELQQYVDTLLIIPNQNLFRVANEKTTFADAFKMADDVLYSGVRGVTDLMVMPGLINLDFADIKSVMSEMGKAMMGTGEAEGERRAVEAAEAAIANPLLDDISMSGAKGVLINITAGNDITLFEVDEAANRIRDEVDESANIIFGSTFEESLEGKVRVSVVATGIESAAGIKPVPIVRQVTGDGDKPAQIAASPAHGIPAQIETSPVSSPAVAMAKAKTPPAALIPHQEEQASQPQEMGQAEVEQSEVQMDAPSAPEDSSVISEEPVVPDAETSATTGEEAFIPAPPDDGSLGAGREPTADPFAVAGMVNASTVEEVKETPKRGALSLFERVTGMARGEKRAEKRERKLPPPPSMMETRDGSAASLVSDMIAQRDPAAPAGPVDREPRLAPEVTPKPVHEPIHEPIPEPEEGAAGDSIVDTAAEEESAPQSLLGGMDSADRITGSEEDEDLLDIPAFLRRQAN